MTQTLDYSRMHAAFADAADAFDVEPFIARVALALMDRPRSGATTHELQADLMLDGSAVRRALGIMYRRRLATGVGLDGGRRRRGVVTHVKLTTEGYRLGALVRVTHADMVQQGGGALVAEAMAS